MAPCNWVTAEGAGGLITGDSADHYTCVLLRHDGAISAVVGVFPHPTALLRLVGVVLVEAHDELEVSYRRYLPRGFLATVPGSIPKQDYRAGVSNPAASSCPAARRRAAKSTPATEAMSSSDVEPSEYPSTQSIAMTASVACRPPVVG